MILPTPDLASACLYLLWLTQRAESDRLDGWRR